MHNLIGFVCDELEELERKVEKEGSLSKTDFEYAKDLASFKKDLMKAEEMSDYSNGYDMRGYSRKGDRTYRMEGSYARKRDALGRYSRRGYSMDNDEIIDKLHDLMEDAPDEKTRMELDKFIRKVETM